MWFQVWLFCRRKPILRLINLDDGLISQLLLVVCEQKTKEEENGRERKEWRVKEMKGKGRTY